MFCVSKENLVVRGGASRSAQKVFDEVGLFDVGRKSMGVQREKKIGVRSSELGCSATKEQRVTFTVRRVIKKIGEELGVRLEENRGGGENCMRERGKEREIFRKIMFVLNTFVHVISLVLPYV